MKLILLPSILILLLSGCSLSLGELYQQTVDDFQVIRKAFSDPHKETVNIKHSYREQDFYLNDIKEPIAFMPVRSVMTGGMGDEEIGDCLYQGLQEQLSNNFIPESQIDQRFEEDDIWEEYLDCLSQYGTEGVIVSPIISLYAQIDINYLFTISSEFQFVNPFYPKNCFYFVSIQLWQLDTQKALLDVNCQGERLIDEMEDEAKALAQIKKKVCNRVIAEIVQYQSPIQNSQTDNGYPKLP